MSDIKSVFRVSIFDSLRLPERIQEECLGYIENQLICKNIMAYAKKKNIPVSVDCQISSQTRDLKKYLGAKLVTPTEVEARSALKDFDCGIAYLGGKLREELEAEHLILKLGTNGALIFTELDGLVRVENIPALAIEKVVDTSGAGDSMMAVATLTLAASNSIFMAVYLGSLAAGLQLTHRGNTPLSKNFWLDG